jgi:hypothetical protein
MTDPTAPAGNGPQHPGNQISTPPADPAEGTPTSEAPGEAGPDAQDQSPYSVGSGRAASDATSRSGKGSTRHEFLREADRLLVEGDVIDSGIKNVFNLPGARRPRPREISHEQMEMIRSAYICPPDFGNIESSYSRARQTAILRGPEGCGKLATAVRLLISEGAEHIFLLDDSITMSKISDAIETDLKGRDRIEKNAGFILNKPADFGNLHSSLLQQLEEPLTVAGARLIITVSTALLGSDNDLLDYIVDQTSRPEPQDIVASHLKYLLGAAKAESELARPEIDELIATALTPDSSCKSSADLADAIVGELYLAPNAQAIDTGRIRSQLTQRSSESFEIWFATLGDTWSMTFAIALAVLNGLPYEVVVGGAKALYRNFDTEQKVMMAATADSLPETRRPFRTSRRALLYRLRAQITRVKSVGPYGLTTADTVEYQNPHYSLSVILHAWSNYQIQDALLQWLEELADDGMELVSIFAGRTLGVLATQSFDYLSSQIFVPWASDEQPHRRAAVAYALRFVAADARLRRNVRSLVSGWYANRDDPALQATAARVYGLALGAYDPITAFEALDRLSTVDDIRVTVAIGDAVVDLLGDASDYFTVSEADDLALFVLNKLREALDQPDRTAMMQLVFLILADGLYTRIRKGGGSSFTFWPFLLRLGQRLPAVRTVLVQLWRYVLNDARYPAESEQVMARWAFTAENDAEMREAFLRLIRAMIRGHERTRAIVSRYTTSWTRPENLRPIPLVGQGLLTVLEAERES